MQRHKSMKERGKLEIKQLKQAKSVTYIINTDGRDLPVFLHIISWLSNFESDGWFGIVSTGLLIFQSLCVMLGPASTCILILNMLKGE